MCGGGDGLCVHSQERLCSSMPVGGGGRLQDVAGWDGWDVDEGGRGLCMLESATEAGLGRRQRVSVCVGGGRDLA